MAEPITMSGLFGVKSPSQMMKERQEALTAEGLLLGKNIGALPSGVMNPAAFAAQYQPKRMERMAQNVAGLFGKRIALPGEREMTQNRQLFTQLQEEATKLFPTDRAKQVEHMAVGLEQNGRYAEAEKARELSRKISLQQAKIGTEQAKREAELAKAAEAKAKTAQTEAETKQIGVLTPKDQAALYEKFTADSIEMYLDGKGKLVPLGKDKREALSTWGKKLVDQGLEPGTPAFEAEMKRINRAEEAAIGQSKVITQMQPLEQTQLIQGNIENDPLYKNSAQRVDKLRLANANISAAINGNAPAITTLQRTLSEVYNGDTRAASEIDRFINDNKSVAQSFTDFLSRVATGELSPELESQYRQLISIAENAVQNQIDAVVDKNMNIYGEFVGADVQERIRNQYGQTVANINDPLGIR